MAPPASKGPATKAPSKSVGKKAPVDGERKKRKKKHVETWSSYIYKVLKQVHPDTGMSKKSMAIMCNFVDDIFLRLATEASALAKMSHKATISAREVQTAVRLHLPGELAKHAISEGTKSVAKFQTQEMKHKSAKANK